MPAFLATALMLAGRGLHAATAAGAGLAGTATLAGAAATAAVGALSDRAGRSLTIIMVASVSLILMLSMGFVLGAPLILAVSVAIIVAVAANADSAVISTTLTENVPGRYLGRALAMYSFCGFSAGTLSPILFGAALDYLNPASLTDTAAVPLRWEGAFGVLALGSLAALAAAVALHKVLRPRAGT
jgi:MFS family permease